MSFSVSLIQGRTREEARENVIDALRTVLTPGDGERQRLVVGAGRLAGELLVGQRAYAATF